jgi:tetratricopeptide (TPR) repeat protein
LDSLSAADKLATALTMQETQKKLIANQAMNSALTSLQKKRYPEAINQLKRVIALDPELKEAYTYLGNTYLQQDNPREAIKVFQQYLRNHPNSEDGTKNLANAYLQAKDFGNAEKQLKFLANLTPTDKYAPYSLGHLYVQTNRLGDAQEQFEKVIRLARSDAYGYYGLGLVYNKLGKPEEAVKQLQQAVQLKKDLAVAHLELGRAYAALGQKEQAAEEAATLKTLDSEQGLVLANELRQPRILVGFSTNFDSTLGLFTPLASLDDSLATPGASKEFSMIFQFDGEMDPVSVQNFSNWSITKAAGGMAGVYNNGVTLHHSEQITPPSMPTRVLYDPTTLQATVTFTLTQNSAGTGLIDPAHLVFKFSGQDIYGTAMDSAADEFDGFASQTF